MFYDKTMDWGGVKMIKTKRVVSIVAALTLALACIASFAGCGSQSSEPQGAKDVIERYGQANPDNFNMKGDVALSMGVSGMTMSMPMSMDFDVNGRNYHGTYSLSLFGAEAKGEMYAVEKDGKILTYSKTDTSGSMFGMTASSGDSEWTVTEMEEGDLSSIEALANELIEKASFEKTENGYLVSFKGEDVYAVLMKAISESETSAASAVSEIPQEITDFIKALNIDLAFDKDCNLTEVSIPETKSSLTIEGQTMDIEISSNLAISKHGEIAEIVVPDDVVNSAKPTSSVVDAAGIAAEASESSASAEASKAA